MDENLDPNLNENTNTNKLEGLHTYQSDMAKSLRENQASVIKIAAAEQKKQVEKIKKGIEIKERKYNFRYIFGTIFIIVLIILGIKFLPSLLKQKIKLQMSTPQIKTLILSNEQVVLDYNLLIGKENSGLNIQKELKKEIINDYIKSILIQKQENGVDREISAQEFINQVSFNMPNALNRSLGEKMMLGSYTQNNQPSLFIIFQTENYEQSFAGILAWENFMFSDLFNLFGINISGENQNLFNKKFSDILIENNDARILRSDTNQPVLYYMFIDRKILIITDKIETLKEIKKRYQISK